MLFGWVLGRLTFYLLRSIDRYQVEVMITLAAVLGGYALANRLQISGPLAMVVAGLVVGHDGRVKAMSETTRARVELFWELIDEMLNAVLFVLVGMQVLVIRFPVAPGIALVATGLAIVETLAARWLTVGLPIGIFQRAFRLPSGSAQIITWGGLRGGLSIAMALSIPSSPHRETIIVLTYGVVAFSILVQGLTFRRVVHASLKLP